MTRCTEWKFYPPKKGKKKMWIWHGHFHRKCGHQGSHMVRRMSKKKELWHTCCAYGLLNSWGHQFIGKMRDLWNASFCTNFYICSHCEEKRGFLRDNPPSWVMFVVWLCWCEKRTILHMRSLTKKRKLATPLASLMFKICYWYCVSWTQKQWMLHCVVGRCSSCISCVVIMDVRKRFVSLTQKINAWVNGNSKNVFLCSHIVRQVCICFLCDKF